MRNKILIQIVVLVTLFLIPITAFSGEWGPMTSGTANGLYSVWGSSATDVFASGNSDTILHYTSGTWSTMTSGTTNLMVVWGSSATDVFVVGASGTIRHYNGTIWSTMTSGTTNNLYGVWGSSATDVFAVGDAGTILHYTSGTWSTMTSGTTNGLYSVWGSSATDVFAVGASGTIRHYNGTTWSTMTSGTTKEFSGVWGSSATDVFAVGDTGTILHFNGTSWSPMTGVPTYYLSGVWGSSATDVFVVGEGGTILHYNGTSWSSMTSGTTSFLVGVWGSSDSNVFAVGASGTILQYTAYSISGTVAGEIQAGVTMTLLYDSVSGDTTTTTTNASGDYIFTDLKNGTYTVTPSKYGYYFDPTTRQVPVNGANVTNVNFTSLGYHSISGTVTGDVKAGVTMTLVGIYQTTTTDSSGNYSFVGLSYGTYTVIPSKINYTFEPPSRQVEISGVDVTGVNFTATEKTYTITGTVTGDTKADVTMTLSGSGSGITTTDASGNYTFTGLSNGTYTVTPSRTNYYFTPTTRQVTISGADVTGVNFVATSLPIYSITGTVTGDTKADVTMTLFGSVSTTTITDASGNYRFTGISNGTYTVTPSRTGYSFEPTSKSVTISGADVTEVNFVATALGGCRTWADVIAKYSAYVSGQATWADVMDCYQEYTTQ